MDHNRTHSRILQLQSLGKGIRFQETIFKPIGPYSSKWALRCCQLLFDRVYLKIFMLKNTNLIKVDIFRGILTSYITLQYSGGQLSRLSVVGFLLSKFIRLTPQVMIFILITFMIPLSGWSGPLWKDTITPIIESCSSNWWYNFFYVQNYLKRDEICAIHTWFLGLDMQFHFISLLFVILLLYKSSYLFNLVMILSLVSCYIFSIIIHYAYDLPPGYVHTGVDEHYLLYYDSTYFWRPWAHAPVFFIGFWFGKIIHDAKFPKITQVLDNCQNWLQPFSNFIQGYCLFSTSHHIDQLYCMPVWQLLLDNRQTLSKA